MNQEVKRLKRLFDKSGKRMNFVAKKAKIHRVSLSYIFHGHRGASKKVLSKIESAIIN